MATVVWYKSGRVQIRAYAGIDKRTKKKRNLSRSLAPGATPEEIEEAKTSLEEEAARIRANGLSTNVESAFLDYIDACKADFYAPSTIQKYESNLRCYVLPYIGSADVADLKPWNMNEMFLELAASGKVDGSPLSQNSMASLYSWLYAAFKWMQGIGYVPQNPMEGCKRIYPKQIEAESISEHDLKKIYKWLIAEPESWDDLSFKNIIRLDLGTGMRRGEISGLQVSDLRYAANDIAISRSYTEIGGLHYKSPKSKASVRRISINPGVTNDLSGYLMAQADMLEEQGLDQRGDSPMFCHSGGSPWRPSELTMNFAALREKLGLDKSVHFHSMRHTHASELLAAGCDIRTLQERLGHASVNTTLRIYGHVLPGRDRAAADAWSAHEERIRNGI